MGSCQKINVEKKEVSFVVNENLEKIDNQLKEYEKYMILSLKNIELEVKD
jgi:hypothetical protein